MEVRNDILELLMSEYPEYKDLTADNIRKGAELQKRVDSGVRPEYEFTYQELLDYGMYIMYNVFIRAESISDEDLYQFEEEE